MMWKVKMKGMKNGVGESVDKNEGIMSNGFFFFFKQKTAYEIGQ